MTQEQLTELYAAMRALLDKLYALESVKADKCKVGDTVLYWSRPKRITKVTKGAICVEDMLTKTKDEWPKDYPITLSRIIPPDDAQYIVDNSVAWFLCGASVDLAAFIALWKRIGQKVEQPC